MGRLIQLLFIPLCVLLGGAEQEQNCEYSWVQIIDREQFEKISAQTHYTDQLPHERAFVDPTSKTVYLYDISINVIHHEIEHVKCMIIHENNDENRTNCNTIIDMNNAISLNQAREPEVHSWGLYQDSTPSHRSNEWRQY